MKKLFVLLTACKCLALFSRSQSQPAAGTDTVYLTSSDIQKLIDDKYYVRVPNTDLEQRLQDKVSTVVAERFNTLYTFIWNSLVANWQYFAF